MLSLLPGEVVALMVLYLADYRDFRQLLWHCRAGGSILARVQSLDVAGVYSREGSGGNPFDYSRFPALRRVSVRLNFLLPHCIYDFMQLSSSVQYLDLLIPHILSIPRLRVLMEFLENDLSEEVQHVGIHLDHWDLFHPARRGRVSDPQVCSTIHPVGRGTAVPQGSSTPAQPSGSSW